MPLSQVQGISLLPAQSGKSLQNRFNDHQYGPDQPWRRNKIKNMFLLFQSMNFVLVVYGLFDSCCFGFVATIFFFKCRRQNRPKTFCFLRFLRFLLFCLFFLLSFYCVGVVIPGSFLLVPVPALVNVFVLVCVPVTVLVLVLIHLFLVVVSCLYSSL